MKRVSFEVAEKLEAIGYPQHSVEDDRYYAYNCIGELWSMRYFDQNPQTYYSAPTYIEVWLWLWRNKGIKIVAEPRQRVFVYIKADFYGLPKELASVFEDPEEAIIKAIEYLIYNNLIK